MRSFDEHFYCRYCLIIYVQTTIISRRHKIEVFFCRPVLFEVTYPQRKRICYFVLCYNNSSASYCVDQIGLFKKFTHFLLKVLKSYSTFRMYRKAIYQIGTILKRGTEILFEEINSPLRANQPVIIKCKQNSCKVQPMQPHQKAFIQR